MPPWYFHLDIQWAPHTSDVQNGTSNQNAPSLASLSQFMETISIWGLKPWNQPWLLSLIVGNPVDSTFIIFLDLTIFTTCVATALPWVSIFSPLGHCNSLLTESPIHSWPHWSTCNMAARMNLLGKSEIKSILYSELSSGFLTLRGKAIVHFVYSVLCWCSTPISLADFCTSNFHSLELPLLPPTYPLPLGYTRSSCIFRLCFKSHHLSAVSLTSLCIIWPSTSSSYPFPPEVDMVVPLLDSFPASPPTQSVLIAHCQWLPGVLLLWRTGTALVGRPYSLLYPPQGSPQPMTDATGTPKSASLPQGGENFIASCDYSHLPWIRPHLPCLFPISCFLYSFSCESSPSDMQQNKRKRKTKPSQNKTKIPVSGSASRISKLRLFCYFSFLSAYLIYCIVFDFVQLSP
jgi:hypothetical protein